MLAFRLNNHNVVFIRHRNGGEVPPQLDFTQYIVFPGEGKPSVLLSEADFYNRYTITTRLNRKQGRFVVEERANDTERSDKSK